MPDMPEQADLLDFAYPYALNALSDAERTDVDHALDQADTSVAGIFRSTVRDIREAMATMTIVDARPAPPDLEASLQRALDAQIAASGTVTPLHARRTRTLRWLAAAAALVAVIALGATIAVNRSQPADSGAVTAQQIITHADTHTATADVTGGGTVTVYTSGQLNAAAISFAAVPPPAAGHTYQLWLITSATAQPQTAGVLDALPADNNPLIMKLDPAARQMALSIEPTGGSPQPTTNPIVAVSLL